MNKNVSQLDQWRPRHDDEHDDGRLIEVARSLLHYAGFGASEDLAAKHPNPRDQLIIAGALIAAEIDRLDRASKEKKS